MLHLNGNAVMFGTRKCGFLSRDTEDNEKIWYISPRTRSKHFFRIWKGWGVTLEIVAFLEKNDVYGIKLVIDGKEVQKSSLPMLRKHGNVIQYEPHETQLVMAEKHWLRGGQGML